MNLRSLSPARALRPAALAFAALSCLAGCTHHFFTAQGTLGSEGSGPLGTWRSTPLGCSRDPVDASDVLPPGAPAQTVATLLWDDMVSRERLLPRHKRHLRNLPARLDLWKTDTGFVGRLQTQKPPAKVVLDSTVCTTLDVQTVEGKPLIDRGRPTLGGTIALNCQAGGNHISGKIAFSGCEY